MSYPICQFLLILFFTIQIVLFLFAVIISNSQEIYQSQQKAIEYQQRYHSSDKLLHVLSHDLGNSLMLILNYSAKIAHVAEDQDMRRYGDCILKAAEIQQEIIDHVKQIQIVNDGKIELFIEPVMIRDVFQTIKYLFKNRLFSKKIEMITNESEFPHLKVIADSSCLTNQILCNLISNAIKFSHEDSQINVNIQVESDEVCITISDDGVGIPENIIHTIFRDDLPTTRPGTKGEKGTGYGMPIVKAYVHHIKGRLEISSKSQDQFPNDHGTTIKVFLRKYV